MKRAKHWLLFIPAAVLLLSLLASTDAALPFKKVSIAKTPASTTSKTTTTTTETSETQETAASADDEEQQVPPSGDATDNAKEDNVTISKNSKLTGIPQIDYIWDPNLPRELRGYNLSSYPFLSTVPPQDEIHFKCEGLHDGFYASIEYKCQIYHHCVYGIRHDFLCANFTAFDQRTFICHFASDVDCEGSQKYWNRNDELYMATTTTSTSTSTTEPPPTQPHRRRGPQRPQRRRPYDHRRPIDDYYYDEEEEQQQYEDDYYEERFNRRQKTKRQRHRKPIKEVDYDDEYDDEKPAAAPPPPPPRRNRNRYRDEDEDPLDEDYDDRRGGIRRRKPATAGRKISARKPQAEGRRSFNEDRTSLLNRRRSNEKRLGGGTTPSSLSSAALDDLDDYEKPYADVDQEEAAEEQTPQKIKTSTAKSLTEFITPKAAAASVYARPRAPPRIARPVPINEKKKYSYPVQKTNTATTTPKSDLDDDYYQQEAQQEGAADDEYEQPLPVRSTLAPSRRRPAGPTRNPLRKPVTEKKVALEEDYYEEPPTTRRKQQQQQARPQARTRAPPPSSAADVDFLDEEDPPIRGQRVRAKPAPRKSIPRPRQPIVEAEDIHADDKDEAEAPPSQRPRVNVLARRKQTRQRIEPQEPVKEQQQQEEQQSQHDDQEPAEELEPVKPSLRPSAVRVVKRPFLPSRGGSPYLPRGLQPVGVALKPSSSPAPPTTQSTPIDMGSTISGVRLLEHGAPLLRSQNNNNNDDDIDVADDDDDVDDAADRILNERRKQAPPLSRTTLPPRSALPPATPKRNQEPQRPKLNLDELYENDYDVTLNDALDPTLKPLSTHSHTHSHPHQHPQQQQQQQQQQLQYRPYASAYNNPFAYQPQQQTQSQPQSQPQPQPQQSLSSLSASSSPAAGGYHSDSYFSSTDIRRRAIVGPSPQGTRSHRHEYPAAGGSAAAVRVAQHFYDDFAY